MSSISVSLHSTEEDPRAEVLAIDSGRQFVSLRFGTTATVILPGFDLESAAYARRTADALINAACRIEQAQAEAVNA